jgi:hypothetical protein
MTAPAEFPSPGADRRVFVVASEGRLEVPRNAVPAQGGSPLMISSPAGIAHAIQPGRTTTACGRFVTDLVVWEELPWTMVDDCCLACRRETERPDR